MSDWLVRRSRRPRAANRLYCFPYAGSTPGEFLRWEGRLPETEVWGVLPPGRGKRLAEPAYTRAADLVDALVRAVAFRPPYALFGHSLGALLAFETARAVRAVGRPAPACLIVSGHRPPHLPHGDEPIHSLAEEAFRELVARRYPPPAAELAEDPELLAQMYRTLRADLAVFETYRYAVGPTLSCPIVVVSGVDDAWGVDELAPWARHTTGGCRIRMVPGDHFYLPQHADEVLKVIWAALEVRPW